MILGGGSSCQKCGCGPGCPSCTFFDECGCVLSEEITGTFTANGNSLGTWSVTPLPVDLVDCGQLQQGLNVSFTEDAYGTGTVEIDGCVYCRISGTVRVDFGDGVGCFILARIPFNYVYIECDADGGSVTFGEPYVDDSDCYSQECEDILLEWAAGLTLTGSVSFPPCVPPP